MRLGLQGKIVYIKWVDCHGTCQISGNMVWEGFCIADKEQKIRTGMYPLDFVSNKDQTPKHKITK